MSVKIVTDSTCDLPIELIEKYQITVLPLYIQIGNKSYRDGIDMTREEFYKGLPTFKQNPTTSAPGIGYFKDIYENLAVNGADEILSIHIAEKLSAVVNVARLASNEVRSVEITVFDSKQLSLGAGYIVLKAAEAALEGK